MRPFPLRPPRALIPLLSGFGLVVLAATPGSLAGDASWPQEFTIDDTRIQVFEPQYETLDQELLKGRAAIAITPEGKSTPIFGAAWIESRVAIDRDARTVRARATKVTQVHLPDSTPGEESRLLGQMARLAPDLDLTTSLDRLTAALDASRHERRAALALNMTPPRILFETSPAFLAVLDGPPKTMRVEGTGLERVVNTPSFIVRDSKTGRHYLEGAGRWYEADRITGPWRSIAEPPGTVGSLWEKGRSRDLASRDLSNTAAESGSPVVGAAVPASGEGQAPRVIVATEPTELIVSDGEPEFAPISGLDLLYMTNTPGDVLMEVGSQRYYVLLSGRWYRSRSLQGPWEHVRPDMLPESFAKIPPGSMKGDLLASVAGTPEAEEAVLDGAVPQTAVIRRSEANLTVTYDGDPEFRPIPRTQVEYAVNTSAQVLRIRDRYYAVDQGVWFVSDSPTGPWTVADDEPPEAQEIPPDTPVYNTKYVYVYDSTPDRVYVGYLPGYLGYYPYYGTVVYGTGWYYPGWWGTVYYPYPWTWGFGAHYSAWAGWSFGFGIGFSYGWYPYSPWYPWGYAGWWGPIGWYPCYAGYYFPYGRYHYGVPVATLSPTRPLRGSSAIGSNLNLYRLPENVTRVARTRDKYAARISPANRAHYRGALASDPASPGRAAPSDRTPPSARRAPARRPDPTGRPAVSGRSAPTNRPSTAGRQAPPPGVSRQAPLRGRPDASAPPRRSASTRPGAPASRSTPAVRPAPQGRASASVRPRGPIQVPPSIRRPRTGPAPGSPPAFIRPAPPRARGSVPSFGAGRPSGGGRSFGHVSRGSGGGGRSFSHGSGASRGRGPGTPRGGHRGR
jgi:hypothetical protein